MTDLISLMQILDLLSKKVKKGDAAVALGESMVMNIPELTKKVFPNLEAIRFFKSDKTFDLLHQPL